MTLEEIRQALEGIALVCNETHRDLQAQSGSEWTAARVKLLAIASHCVSAGRLVEDLEHGPVRVLAGDEDDEGNGRDPHEA